MHTIPVDNPLQQPVTLAVSATKGEDLAYPTSLVIPANGSAALKLTFRPLLVGAVRATLRISSKELGVEEHVLQVQQLCTCMAHIKTCMKQRHLTGTLCARKHLYQVWGCSAAGMTFCQGLDASPMGMHTPIEGDSSFQARIFLGRAPQTALN